jgi:hypothetical protein
MSLVHDEIGSVLNNFSFLSQSASTSPRLQRVSGRKESLVRKYKNYRQQQIILASEPKKLIVLISNGCHDRTQSSNQSKALDWFNSRSVPYILVDGNDARQRGRRNELFEVSTVRGNYPQFFFQHKDGNMSYFNFERLEGLNETSGLPPEVLAQHPELETWEKVFGTVVEEFE